MTINPELEFTTIEFPVKHIAGAEKVGYIIYDEDGTSIQVEALTVQEAIEKSESKNFYKIVRIGTEKKYFMTASELLEDIREKVEADISEMSVDNSDTQEAVANEEETTGQNE